MRLLKWTRFVFVLLAATFIAAVLSVTAVARPSHHLKQYQIPPASQGQEIRPIATCREMARALYLPVVNKHPHSALKKLWVTGPKAVDLYFAAGCPWQVLMQANPGGVEYRPEKTMELDSYLLLRFQAIQQMQIALGFLHGTGDPGDRNPDEWAQYLPKFINAMAILRDQAPQNGGQPAGIEKPPGSPDCGQVVPAFIAHSGLWLTPQDMITVTNRVRMRAWLATGCSMKALFAADDSLPGCRHVVAGTEQDISNFVAVHYQIMLAEDRISRPLLAELARLLVRRNMERMKALMRHQCVVSV